MHRLKCTAQSHSKLSCTVNKNSFTRSTVSSFTKRSIGSVRHTTESTSRFHPWHTRTTALKRTSSSILHRFFCNAKEGQPPRVMDIRNVAIIAHVDHGKTTMVDELLKQSGTLKSGTGERVMDSNTLEKERGITIFSKYTSMFWNGTKINLVDTPGHGDFGGEVERIVHMVDGCILLVDAAEGPQTQTKFVLSKALKANLKPIVVLNKMDKENARPVEVENEIFDLFYALEANEEQMNYPLLFASARGGWAVRDKAHERKDMSALFDAIISYVPKPKILPTEHFAMLVSTFEYDTYLGRIGTGRVFAGSVKVNDTVHAMDSSGKTVEVGKVTKIIARHGLDKITLPEAHAGDIIGLAGLQTTTVAYTISAPEHTTPIPSIPIDPPVLSVTIAVNSSPLAGKEGTQHTYMALRNRLVKEAETNISLQLKQDKDSEGLELCGRGELQLGIVFENLRREGFEFTISPPRVIYSKDAEGRKLEPLEELTLDIDEEYISPIIEKMTARKAELKEMKQYSGKSRLVFLCPSRALVGLRGELMTETRGSAVINHLFHSWVPYMGKIDTHRKGALISTAQGTVTTYALLGLEPRGIMFVAPGQEVYPGMVVGEHNRENDLEVNPTKQKHVTNMRSVQKEEFVRLTPPKILTLEETMAYCRGDEMIEVTPKSIRLRKGSLGKRRKGDDDE